MNLATIVLSEWTKLRSLRSTLYTLLAVIVLAAGLGALIGQGIGNHYAELTEAEKSGFDPTFGSLQSFMFVQLAVSVLGVLVVTSEYATGMIRTSLVAVPDRKLLLAAKGAVVGTVALVVGQAAAFASYFIGQALIANAGAPASSLATPSVLRAVIGAGLYLTLICLLGMAVGVLVRATAGAIVIMVSGTLLVSVFAPILPVSIAKIVGTYWPTMAGSRILSVVPDPNLLSPWVGFLVLLGFVAAMLGVAGFVFHRRDA